MNNIMKHYDEISWFFFGEKRLQLQEWSTNTCLLNPLLLTYITQKKRKTQLEQMQDIHTQ